METKVTCVYICVYTRGQGACYGWPGDAGGGLLHRGAAACRCGFAPQEGGVRQGHGQGTPFGASPCPLVAVCGTGNHYGCGPSLRLSSKGPWHLAGCVISALMSHRAVLLCLVGLPKYGTLVQA